MSGERGYLDLVKRVIETGEFVEDRTGTGTLTLFAPPPVVYEVGDSFPLFTTKHVSLRNVFEELLFFLRGETDGRKLLEKGIKIWEANGNRAFLTRCGFSEDRPEHDLGPIYGFNWRHFGAEYRGTEADYTGQGFDQIAWLIEKIKTRDTTSARRLVLTSLNPSTVSQCVLPPCHLFAQFHVRNGDTLDCLLYQRSGDLGLGVPYNVASYSILLHLMARVTDTKPGRLTHMIGEAHVYLNHVEPLLTQLERVPTDPPKVRVTAIKPIDEYQFDDIECVGYQSQGRIDMKLSA